MANEILFSTLGDARSAEAIAGQWALLRADRGALPNHPALQAGYFRAAKGIPSTVITLPAYGLDGYNQMAPFTTENDSVTNTALSTGVRQYTLVRQALARESGWAALLTDMHGALDFGRLAKDGFEAARMRLVAMIAALGGGLSTTVGVSGNDLTIAQLLGGKVALRVGNAQSRPLAVLHSVQVGDIELELLTAAGGQLQWDPESGAMKNSMGGGYVGTMAGIDICESNQVPTANGGADRAGGLFTSHSVVWGDAAPEITDPNNQLLVGDVLIERERDARAGTTIIVASYLVGVAEGDDGAGIGVTTDA